VLGRVECFCFVERVFCFLGAVLTKSNERDPYVTSLCLVISYLEATHLFYFFLKLSFPQVMNGPPQQLVFV